MTKQVDSLIGRHALILIYIASHPSATQREVARRVEMSEHRTGEVIRELIEMGILSFERQGVRNVYRVNNEAHFRHPMLSHRSIGEFTKVFAAPES